MSFSNIDQAPARLNRSQLFVLANRPETFEAAATSEADVIMFEIEDAIPPDEKPQARKNIIEALNDIDWGKKSISMRINGLDTPYMYRDLVDILEAPTERLDLILIPKAGTAADIYAVDMLVTQIEQAAGRKKPIAFQIMIETAQGMATIDEIAAASPRNDSLHLGENDYATSIRARMKVVGGPNPDYHVLTDPDEDGARQRHWGDMWHSPYRAWSWQHEPKAYVPSMARFSIHLIQMAIRPLQCGPQFSAAKGNGAMMPRSCVWPMPYSHLHVKTSRRRDAY